MNEDSEDIEWQVQQHAVLKTKSAEQMLNFAIHHPESDIASLQKGVMDYGDGWNAYQFAMHVPGADIDALQQVILERGTGNDAYYFAKYIPGADITKLQDVIIARGSGFDAYAFACILHSTNIKEKTEELQQVVIERGRAMDIYYFARDVVYADSKALHRKIIETGTPKEMYDFAADMPTRADLSALQDRLTQLHEDMQDNGYLNRFTHNSDIQDILIKDEHSLSHKLKIS